jgi:hypothetical protein
MDIDSIPPGVDFEKHIRKEIQVCDLVLVLIGDNWLDPGPHTDTRRIDEPDDFVRLEIESALSSPRVRVVPVLVEGAQMPRAADLPESIRGLARINAIELSDRRWTADLERLAALVERIGREQEEEARRTRLLDVQEQVVMAAVASMPESFHTKDISQDPEVRRAHSGVSGLSNYDTMIGRYLSKHHVALGLRPPEAAIDERGATWRKEPSPRLPHYPAVQSLHPSQLPAPGTLGHVTTPRPSGSQGRTTPVGWLMVALPVLTCGLGAFGPAMWAALRRRQDRVFSRRMLVFGASIGAFSILGLGLLVSAPTDSSGTPSGSQSDIGGVMWLVCIVIATIVAVLFRKSGTTLPGTELELARRRERQQYRNLIGRDPNLARSINVGRPDLQRTYSDGGLLDVNGLPAEALSKFGCLPIDEAQRVVETRQRIGRLSSVDEVVAYANLSEATIARLRETAVFL